MSAAQLAAQLGLPAHNVMGNPLRPCSTCGNVCYLPPAATGCPACWHA